MQTSTDFWILISDPMMLVYAGIFAVSTYGLCLFAWWWYVKKAASEVYIYVMMLFLSKMIQVGVSMWARYNFLFDTGMFEDIIMSRYWAMRLLPSFIIVSLIVIRMTQRAMVSIRMSEEFMKVDECSHVVRNGTMSLSAIVKKAIKQIRNRDLSGAIRTLNSTEEFVKSIEVVIADCHVAMNAKKGGRGDDD